MPAQAPIKASRQLGAFMGDEDWPTDLEAKCLSAEFWSWLSASVSSCVSTCFISIKFNLKAPHSHGRVSQVGN